MWLKTSCGIFLKALHCESARSWGFHARWHRPWEPQPPSGMPMADATAIAVCAKRTPYGERAASPFAKRVRRT